MNISFCNIFQRLGVQNDGSATRDLNLLFKYILVFFFFYVILKTSFPLNSLFFTKTIFTPYFVSIIALLSLQLCYLWNNVFRPFSNYSHHLWKATNRSTPRPPPKWKSRVQVYWQGGRLLNCKFKKKKLIDLINEHIKNSIGKNCTLLIERFYRKKRTSVRWLCLVGPCQVFLMPGEWSLITCHFSKQSQISFQLLFLDRTA